jgi:hypothetical protein
MFKHLNVTMSLCHHVISIRHEVVELSLLTADEITAHCQQNYGSLPTKLRLSANEITVLRQRD